MPEQITYAVTDPATGEVVATYPTATDAEVQAALTAAHKATTWGRSTTVAERTVLLTRVADLHHQRRKELAATATIYARWICGATNAPAAERERHSLTWHGDESG
ncbi:aldehyde dehydrogenase family protein [Actinomadura sp. 3N407]|uniref:aldehyde dehydrogenase family protein n=1 Tax=Actinomadura sp. 3N407 TaxID=3457423 RepID=UPI003FCC28B9